MCDKDEKCDLTNLSDYEKKMNELRQTDMYKGTYLVCIVYGLFAIGILLGSYVNETFRDLFFNQFIIFTLIFILGSIIIISVLVYYINNYVPKKVKHDNYYDTYSCPDYWNMVMLDTTNVYKNYDSNISADYFKYKCVPNPNIFNKYNNYKDINPNYKQNNYNLTNNLLNTSNLDPNTMGDYFNNVNASKIQNNINNNMGHLYKNINDINTFPINKAQNYFVYSSPGAKMTDDNFSNIRNTIIDSSLRMNNYSFDTNSNVYSNINTNSFNQLENPDPYIIWNANNDLQTTVATNYSTSSTYQYNNSYYENFYVYKWIYFNIKYSNYINLFKIDDNITTQVLSVYAASNANSIQIGTLTKDKDNIYFQAIPHTPPTSAGLLFNITPRDANNNNVIIDTYIDSQGIYSSTSTPTIPTSDQLTSLSKGPKVIIDNGYGRPPVISKDQIKNNTLNIPVVCDTVYPAYLASVEDINAYGADNTIRCSYARLCGYSWSDMGCN